MLDTDGPWWPSTVRFTIHQQPTWSIIKPSTWISWLHNTSKWLQLVHEGQDSLTTVWQLPYLKKLSHLFQRIQIVSSYMTLSYSSRLKNRNATYCRYTTSTYLLCVYWHELIWKCHGSQLPAGARNQHTCTMFSELNSLLLLFHFCGKGERKWEQGLGHATLITSPGFQCGLVVNGQVPRSLL